MYTVYKYRYVHATAQEAAAPTVFMFFLPAWVTFLSHKQMHLKILPTMEDNIKPTTPPVQHNL